MSMVDTFSKRDVFESYGAEVASIVFGIPIPVLLHEATLSQWDESAKYHLPHKIATAIKRGLLPPDYNPPRFRTTQFSKTK